MYREVQTSDLGIREKMDPNSFQRCTTKGWKATIMNCRRKNADWVKRKVKKETPHNERDTERNTLKETSQKVVEDPSLAVFKTKPSAT